VSIKSTTLVLAIAATLITTPALIVLAPQLAYGQQGPSTNSNFQLHEQPAPPRYQIAIPANWIGPAFSPESGMSFQNPDQSQTITIIKQFPGLYTMEQWIDAKMQDLASKGKTLNQDVQRSWQGIYPARVLMYPDHISVWIEAHTRIFYVAADGAVMNDQTIIEVLNSFQIQEPTPQELQQIANQNYNFYCIVLGGTSTLYSCVD
jgi:hypothetical protein